MPKRISYRKRRQMSDQQLADIRDRIISLLTIEPRDFRMSDLVDRIVGAGVCTEHYLVTELRKLVEDGKVEAKTVRNPGPGARTVRVYRAHRFA